MSSDLTLELVLRLLPEQEELDELRTAILRAAVPDPAMEWSRSGAFATIDKRVVAPKSLADAIDEAERTFERYGEELFSSYRALIRAYTEGRHEDAVQELAQLAERKELAGLFPSARRYLETGLALGVALTDKRPQVLVLRRLGRVSRAAGSLNEAISYYERSAELARDAGDLRGRAIALVGAGSVLALQGRWPDAERHHHEALKLLQADDSEERLLDRGQIYNNLGYFAARQDRLDEADEWLGQALLAWEGVESSVDLGVCHHCLALVRKARGEWDRAREHYRAALELPLPASVRAGVSIDVADLCLQAGDVDGAERWGRIAEDEAIGSRSPYLLGRVYQVRGNVAREAGNEDGFTFYEKALEIARERELRLLEGETLLDYSLLRSRMGEADEARSYLERAREIFEGAGASAELSRVDEMLGHAVVDKGLPREVAPGMPR